MISPLNATISPTPFNTLKWSETRTEHVHVSGRSVPNNILAVAIHLYIYYIHTPEGSTKIVADFKGFGLTYEIPMKSKYVPEISPEFKLVQLGHSTMYCSHAV